MSISKKTKPSQIAIHIIGLTILITVIFYIFSFMPININTPSAFRNTRYADVWNETKTDEVCVAEMISAFTAATEPVVVDLYSLPPEVLNTIPRGKEIELFELKAVETEEKTPRYVLTDKEKKMISVTVWNADHTDDESLACCIQVILNRVFESGKFPDTVEKVLRARGQFESCDKILYDKKYYDYDYVVNIIDEVCGGYDPFEGELAIFYAAERVPGYKIARNLYLIKKCGKSKFWGQG